MRAESCRTHNKIQEEYITKKSDLSIRTLEKNLYLHYMYCQPEYKEYIYARCSAPYRAEYVFKSQIHQNTECKHGIPVDYRDMDCWEESESKSKGKSNVKKKWEKYRHYLSNGKLSPKDLEFIAHYQLDNVPKLFAIHPLGRYFVMNGRMKGTAQYCRKMASIVRGKSEKIAQKKRFLYFLTVTYNPKVMGTDRLSAWENYGKYLAKLNRWLRNRYGALFVRALESTKNQYPHAHYLIGTSTPIDFNGHKKINQKIGTETEFYEGFNEVFPAPVFCLLPAQEKAAMFYISKYISKSQNNDLRKMKVPESRKERKEWLKEMATMFIPVVACVRQIEYSRNIDKTPDLPQEVLKELNRTKEVLDERMESRTITAQAEIIEGTYKFDFKGWREWYQSKFEFTRKEMARVQAGFAMFHMMLNGEQKPRAERAELDMLLTNSTKLCVCATRIGGGKALAERFGDEDIDNAVWDNETLGFIMEKTRAVGCHGCPLARFSARLQGVKCDAMPPTTYNISDYGIRAFKKADELALTRKQIRELKIGKLALKRLAEDESFRYCFNSKKEKMQWINNRLESLKNPKSTLKITNKMEYTMNGGLICG